MSRRYTFRHGFRFSVDGGHAACLATCPGSGQVHAELWTLTGQGPRCRLRAPVAGTPERADALPVAGGRLLLSTGKGQRRQLSLLGPGGVCAAGAGTGLWVTAAPAGQGLALALAPGPAGATDVLRVDQDADQAGALRLTPVARVATGLRAPAVVVGSHVVFASGSAPVVPQVLDPRTGQVSPLALPPEVRSAVPGCAAGDALLLGVEVGQRHRVAVTTVRRPGGYEVWDGLDEIDGLVRPLALDPTGAELVLRVRTGIRSRLVRHRRRPSRGYRIAAPPGTPVAVAAWPPGGLWLPYSTTTAPGQLWWLPPGGRDLRGPAGDADTVPAARTESFPGPAGPVEAVVYGDWRTAERVVVALHGGPAEHWPLAFDPGLYEMASAGLAVVAPNPRGSTGYGLAHRDAIKGAWGGPDLDDILAVASELRRVRGRRPPVALYGTSYGAFLALLALAATPDGWSGCVAVAPFLSGARLHAETTAPVRALLDRLEGTTLVADEAGPRDLLRQVPRMRGRVLVIHGDQDERIPVAHSRALVAALRHQASVEVTYRELAGRGHVAIQPAVDVAEFTEVLRFLAGTRQVRAGSAGWSRG